jgi:Mg-chelatase subunit ChlD
MNGRSKARRIRRYAPVLGWLLLVLLTEAASAASERDLVLVLDNSGSMRGNDSGFLIKDAVSGFVDRLADGDRVAIVIFDHRVDLAVPLTALDPNSRPRVLAALERIDYRGRFTDSPSAMERALYELKTAGRAEAQRQIVFLTDGIVDTGDPARDQEQASWLRQELADDAARHGIKVYGLAFTEDADLQLIQSLAVRTGGEYFRALKAEDLAPAMLRIADAIMKEPQPQTPAVAKEPAPGQVEATRPVSDAEAQLAAGEEQAETAGAGEEAPPVAITEPQGTAADEAGKTVQPMGPIREPAPAAEAAGSAEPEPVVAEQGVTQEAMGEPEALARDEPAVAAPAAPPGEVSRLDQLTLAVAVLAGAVLLLVLYLLLGRRAPKAVRQAAAPRLPEVRAFLDDLDGVTGKLRHELTGERITVGRGLHGDAPGAQHIQIPRDTVSRLHGSFEKEKGAYWVVDNGSINGIFVNGERVHGKRRLASGDRVRFHEFNFTFGLGEDQGDDDRTVLASAAVRRPPGSAPGTGPAARSETPAPEPVGERLEATVIMHKEPIAGGKGPEAEPTAGLDRTVVLKPGTAVREQAAKAGANASTPAGGVRGTTDEVQDRTLPLGPQGAEDQDRTRPLGPQGGEDQDRTEILGSSDSGEEARLDRTLIVPAGAAGGRGAEKKASPEGDAEETMDRTVILKGPTDPKRDGS